MGVLVQAVQDLSMARDLATIMAIVRKAARTLTGADGATFVLRDGECCYYADEDAIEPLWKGKRFPLRACISGWAMLHREAVVLENIYADPRIPADAYRPTFVKSLVMVPIRQIAPVGAIGNYWATRQRPAEHNVRLLQALADSTSTAMENVELFATLESRVIERTAQLAERTAQLEERTAQLETANRELEAFSYAVSHDLRAPVRAISGMSEILLEDHGRELDAARRYVERISAASGRMGQLIEDLLKLSKTSRATLGHAPFDLAGVARDVVEELRRAAPDRTAEVVIPGELPAAGDARMVRIVLENLLGNAWKFTGKRDGARIEVGGADGAFFVRDNGVGFDSAAADKLFTPFQRLHDAADFAGTGIGLATAHRIVQRHGGKIWADSRPGAGATFWFSLG